MANRKTQTTVTIVITVEVEGPDDLVFDWFVVLTPLLVVEVAVALLLEEPAPVLAPDVGLLPAEVWMGFWASVIVNAGLPIDL